MDPFLSSDNCLWKLAYFSENVSPSKEIIIVSWLAVDTNSVVEGFELALQGFDSVDAPKFDNNRKNKWFNN